MSFGGGSQYTLEYLIKVTNQGGASGLNQVNTGLKQVNQNVQNVGISQEKLSMINDKVTTSNNRVIQGTQGVSKAMKGLAFGVLGITTAGAEFVGMLSMWRTTQVSVKEATDAQTKALKEGGKESKAYKDATNELAKANRWARMTFRNLMLSMFDMVPFFILTINGIVKLRTAYKALHEAQLEQKAIQAVLKSSNIGLAESNVLANSSYATLTKTQRIAKAEQALMIQSNELLAASNTQVAGSNLATIPILSKQTAGMGKLSAASSKLSGVGTKVSGAFTGIGAAASGLLKKLLPIVAIIGTIVIAAEAWKNNWGGVGDLMNEVGVKIGNIHPILKQTMEILAKVGLSVDALIHGNFSKIQSIWAGAKEEIGDTGPTEAQTKAMEELSQSVHEATVEAADFIEEIAMADKSGRKDFFKNLGITTGKTVFDNAKKQANEFFNTMEDGFKKLNNVGSQLKTLRGIEALSKLGVKVGADLVKKIRFSMEDKLRDAFKGDKGSIFEKLADVIEKNATASTPQFNAAVAKFAADTPGLVKLLEESGFGDIGSEIQDIIDKQKLGQTTGTAIKKSFQTPEFTNAIGDISSYIMGTNTDKKDEDKGKGGMFDDIKTQIEQFTKDIPGLMKKVTEEFKKVNWGEIFTKFRMSVFDPMLTTALIVGENIATNIWTAMANTIEQRKSEGKIKLTLPDFFEFTANDIKSQKPKEGWLWERKWFKDFISNVQKSYTQLVSDIQNNPYVKSLAAWINDPVGSLINFVQNIKLKGEELNKQVEDAGMHIVTPQELLEKVGFLKYVDTIAKSWQGVLTTIQNNEAIQGLISLWNDPWKTIQEWGGKIADALKGQKAEAATVPTVDITVTVTNAEAISAFDEITAALNSITETAQVDSSMMQESLSSIAKTAEGAASLIRKYFGTALQDIYDTMKDLASQWSKFCNSMIANAKSAAKGITKALNSIPKEIVTIHRIVTVGSVAKGGPISLAQGGPISAAGGKILTTNGPRLFQIGDNPGGRESVWAIPHDNPGPTVAKIDRMYKGTSQGGGVTVFNGMVQLNISGNSIVNDTKLNKRINMTIGENMDVYGN